MPTNWIILEEMDKFPRNTQPFKTGSGRNVTHQGINVMLKLDFFRFLNSEKGKFLLYKEM